MYAYSMIGNGGAVLLALVMATACAPGQADAPMIRWNDALEVAEGGGHRGPWRMNDSEFHYVDDPTPAINDAGHTAVTWVDNARQDVYFQLYAPDGTPRHPEPVNVSRSPEIFSWLPRMHIGSGENPAIYVLWQEIIFSGGSHGGEILFARSTDADRSFSPPLNLSNTTAGAGKGRTSPQRWHNGSLDLARCPDGHLYAAWTEYEGALWFSKSTDNGRSFTEPAHISGGNDSPARGPALATGADGAVFLVWTMGEESAGNLRLAQSSDHGRSFSEPRVVHADSRYADAPKLALDADGVLHLVHAERTEGRGERYQIHYSRMLAGEADFEAPRVLSAGRHATPEGEEIPFESAGFPYLALTEENTVLVAWELFPRAGGRSFGLAHTSSRDGGESFASAALVPGTLDPRRGVNGSQQGLLMRKLAANAGGQAALVNSTFRPEEHSHIWLFRGSVERE